MMSGGGGGATGSGVGMPGVAAGAASASASSEPNLAAVLAVDIEQTLKRLIAEVGIAMHSRVRLSSILQAIRTKQEPLTYDEMILLQLFGLGQGSPAVVEASKVIANYHALEMECVRYRTLTQHLASVLQQSKKSLREELAQKQEQEMASAAAAAAFAAAAASVPISIEDDEEDGDGDDDADGENDGEGDNGGEGEDASDVNDDVPLASRGAIDLTAESPAPQAPAFDINMGAVQNDGLNDALLNLNAEQFNGVDLSFLNFGGDMGESVDIGANMGGAGDNDLLGSIDFSALLGNK